MKTLVFYISLTLAVQMAMGSDLTRAIDTTNLDLARKLIIEKRDVNTQDAYGWTPLMYAARNGEVELCKLLITNGAAIDVKDNDGIAIIDHLRALNFGYRPESRKQLVELFKDAYLIQQGKVIPIDSTAISLQVLKNVIEGKKQTIMKSGLTSTNVEYAAVNAPDTAGTTLLMQYAAVGDIDACKYLLQHGAKADIKDLAGKTVIDYVCTRAEIVDEKVKANIIALFKSSDGKPSQ